MNNIKETLIAVRDLLQGHILVLIIILVIVFGIPVTFYLAKQQQDLRSKATDAGRLVFIPPTPAGSVNIPNAFDLEFGINLDSGTRVTGADVTITYTNNLRLDTFSKITTFLPEEVLNSRDPIVHTVHYVAVSKSGDLAPQTYVPLGTLTFTAISAGTATVTITANQIVAKDQSGTLAIGNTTTTYTVAGPPGACTTGSVNSDGTTACNSAWSPTTDLTCSLSQTRTCYHNSGSTGCTLASYSEAQTVNTCTSHTGYTCPTTGTCTPPAGACTTGSVNSDGTTACNSAWSPTTDLTCALPQTRTCYHNIGSTGCTLASYSETQTVNTCTSHTGYTCPTTGTCTPPACTATNTVTTGTCTRKVTAGDNSCSATSGTRADTYTGTGCTTATANFDCQMPCATGYNCDSTTSTCVRNCINGDTGDNGCVDINDYNTWYSEFTGAASTKTADFYTECNSSTNQKGDGVIDINDYNIWRREFDARRHRCS